MRDFPNWIGNRAKSGTPIDIRSPWDGTVVARATSGTKEDVLAAIESAAAAFPAIRQSSSVERAGWLEGIAAGLDRVRDGLAEEICLEAGKPVALARAEVDRAITTFKTGAEEARRTGGEVMPLDLNAAARGRFGMTRRFPKGIVAGIVPFNFPLNLAAHKVAPALAAGCPIVLKPPPQAPGPTLWLGELARDAGVPEGAVNVVFAPVAEAAPLVEDERVQVLSFTGSAAVGWQLKARAPRKTVILELGGNAAVLVDGSADLEYAATRCAIAGFAFAGQVCIKAQRLFVERAVYPEFRERLLAAIATKVPVGDPALPETVCGPVIDDAAAERITGWTGEAVRSGAIPIREGRRNGRLLEPTVLENAPPDALISREEVFGPVCTLSPFDSMDQAVAAVNAGPYGLQAGLFTKDLGRTLKAFEGIEVGALVVNDAPTFRVDPMPYGGVKASGFGREGLRYAIEEMTELRLLVLPPAS